MSGAMNSLIGYPSIKAELASYTTEVYPAGSLLQLDEVYWGVGEFLFVRANGAIAQYGLVELRSAFDSTLKRWINEAVPLANTANLGVSVGVAPLAIADDGFGWIKIAGVIPVSCGASVAANTAWGVTAAGQGGAVANGKQILGSRVIAAATTTVAKTNCSSESGSYELTVPDTDGWFVGAYLSGTGVGSSAKVSKILSKHKVIMDVVTTAAIAGTVTATYNNATIYYNVVQLNRSFAQGQVT